MSVIKEKDLPKILKEVESEIGRIVVGQKETVRGIIRAVLCNGHVLIEGVPGIAKTLMIRAVSEVLGCEMKRIQFTVDLLPTDITGITSYSPNKGFSIIKGPIFANFIIADEINRSPPKSQSALLEAMQERTVTIARKTYELPKPFFVLATENPIEVSGVYALPEAQVDRFIFKLLMGYTEHDEEIEILSNNITLNEFDSYHLKKVLSAEKIISLQEMTKKVFSSDSIKEYIVKLVEETRKKDFEYSKYISFGASPRASISLYIASKAEALLNGRKYVVPKDVKIVAASVLRHRIILNYEAEAERISTDKIIENILEKVKVP
ncbi:MAG: MoxR family ATPase [Nanoarchaeota archaeon]